MINANGREYFQLRLYSDHKETLEEVQKFLECGNIYQKKLSKKNKNWSDSFELTITTKEDIYIILTQILPFLVKRKEEVEQLLKTHKLFKDFRDVSREVSNSFEDRPDEEEIKETIKEEQELEKQEQDLKQAFGEETFKEDTSYIG